MIFFRPKVSSAVSSFNLASKSQGKPKTMISNKDFNMTENLEFWFPSRYKIQNYLPNNNVCVEKKIVPTSMHIGPENLKKSRQKNLWNQFFFREIAFLNFFPVQKLTFGHFWNGKKWNLVKINFREIDLFDFTSFWGLDFFKFSGLLYT